MPSPEKLHRICHVIQSTEAGGAQTMLCQLVNQLASKYDMHVISLLPNGPMEARLREMGVALDSCQFRRGKPPSPMQLMRLLRLLRRLRPHVVQTWTYHADLFGGFAARLATRARVFWNIRHGSLDPRINSANVLRSARMCAKVSPWLPDRILINSEAAIDEHVRAGYDASKLILIPNGFDIERFRPDPALRRQMRHELRIDKLTELVGMSARFHPHKGHASFVAMAKRVARQRPQTRFLLCGSGCTPDNAELMGWLREARLDTRFHLLGPRDDMPRVLNALDLCVLASTTEGVPNALGEAMACGIPVVATNVGDVRPLVGDAGVVVPAGSIDDLAEQAMSVLSEPLSARNARSQFGRRRIQDRFEIGDIVRRYESEWLASFQGQVASPDLSGPPQPARPSIVSPRGSSTSRPKLVHVTTIPLTPWLFLRGQNSFMSQHGLDVHVVTSPGSFLAKLRERDRVATHAIPISRRIQPWRDGLSILRLYRLFRQLRPEIVQLSTPKAALLGALAARAARVPIRIYQVRGLSSESEVGWKQTLYRQFERLTARLCNAHFVNAPSLLAYAQHKRILRSGIVAGHGMSNGVDLSRFDPDQVRPADLSAWISAVDGPIIGYVGRLTRDKGIEDLEAAWSTLRSEFPKACLLLVGPWEHESAISEACRQRLLEDPRVLVTGLQDDVASYYKVMDLFAFPTHGTEGFPNAPMEAAAMRLPVVASRVMGCVDAVDDELTGTLVSPRSPDALREALRSYLTNSLLRREHGRAGRRRIEEGFAPELLWTDFLNCYADLLRQHKLAIPEPQSQLPLSKAA